MDRTARSSNDLLKLHEQTDDPESRFVLHDAVIVTNSQLRCACCVHMWPDSVVECEIFEQKPLTVLRGGDCPDLELR